MRSRTRKPIIHWLCNTIEQRQQGIDAVELLGIQREIDITYSCYAAEPDLTGADLVIIDEAHHAGSEQIQGILRGYKGALWLFTATPFGEDEDRNQILRELCENRIHVVPRSAVKDRVLHGNVVMLSDSDSGNLGDIIDAEIERALNKRMSRFSVFFPPANKEQWVRIACVTHNEDRGDSDFNQIRSHMRPGEVKEIDRKLYEAKKGECWSQCAYLACMQLGIIPNAARNRAVIRVAKEHVAAGDTVIALIYSITHGEALAAHVPGAVVMHSKMGVKKRREAVAGIRNGDIRCAFATTMLEEGFDAPRANVLIQAGAGRSSRKAEQTTGRVLRAFGDQTHGTIYDFHDTFHPLTAKQSKRRQELYRQLGYSIKNASEIQQPALI